MSNHFKKSVLVTGATGFIGRHLVQSLFSQGKYNIICLVRNPVKVKALLPQSVRFIYGDISKVFSLNELMGQRIDIIFHCAGYVSNKNPFLLHKVNVLGTEEICRLALKLNVERMIYLSSVAVVSGNKEVPLTEELPYAATNTYGESKIIAEKKVLEYRQKGLRAVILRPCMVYGEDEPHMLKLLLFLLKYRLLPLLDGGRNKFHLVYVKNIVEAIIFALDNDDFLKGSFFVADREILSTKKVFTTLAQAIGSKEPFHLPDFIRPLILNIPNIGKKLRFFIKDRVYSIDRIKSLGFIPPYPTEESLVRSAKTLYSRQ